MVDGKEERNKSLEQKRVKAQKGGKEKYTESGLDCFLKKDGKEEEDVEGAGEKGVK